MTQTRKKLIEVALPLEAINKESVHEKARRRGLPSALHLWWSRKPLATARAVLFAQLVDDPSSCPDEFPTSEMQEAERQRLFRIIEKLVKWENSNNEDVLHVVRTEIARSVARTQGVKLPHSMTSDQVVAALRRYAPPVLDLFAGGGSIPLEAQRLGLEAHASDLNPVAVLINKTLIEIPPKFANCSPVNPESSKTLLHREWRGAQGLEEDIRYYGKLMRNEAKIRIGHLYPKITLPKKYGEGEATIIAWIWGRTVRCPNPACGALMPLTSKWTLSTKRGKEAWIEPIIDHVAKAVHFEIRQGLGSPEGTVNRQGARCLVCSHPVSFDYIRAEGQAGWMGRQLMAIAVEGNGGRVYLPPSEEQEAVALHAKPQGEPETSLPKQALGFRVQSYGMTMHRDLFTARQLATLTTFSDLVDKAREQVLADAYLARMPNDGVPLSKDGAGASAYADAVATYLGMVVSKMSNRANALSPWMPEVQCPGHLFSRQAISMSWDFAEGNSLDGPSGSWESMLDEIIAGIHSFSACHIQTAGVSKQLDAASAIEGIIHPLISTDPPYYDNISYADLSDFFYVWLRRSLRTIYPDLFSTFLVPKVHELVATPFRFDGDKKRAQDFFEDGLGKAFSRMRVVQHLEYPLTLYYAFKQAESDADEDGNGSGSMMSASTGWETMLEGLIKAGFVITGTWPMRTERSAMLLSASYHRHFGTSSAATSHQLTSRRLLSALAWLSSHAIARCLSPTELQCVCVQHYRSLIKHSTRSWPSRKGSTMPAPAGLSPGLSSMAWRKVPTASPRHSPRLRTALWGPSSRRASCMLRAARCGCCVGMSSPATGILPR